jgi:F-type H+-transporting ATPase subunit epsilon
VVAVDSGFFSVDSNRVVIVADNATIGGSVPAGNR